MFSFSGPPAVKPANVSWLMVEVAKPKKLKIHQSLSVESGMFFFFEGKPNLGEGM